MKGTTAIISLLLVACTYAAIVDAASADRTQGYADRLASVATIVYVPEQGKRQPNDIYKFIDSALKAKYWYYLTNARLLYAAAVEKGDTYQFLAIYRNYVGTFLAITSWKNQSDTFNVDTLVRLGNGDAKDLGANYDPVAVNLQYFRFALGKDEFIVYSADGFGNELNGDTKDMLLVKECKLFSNTIRNNFWYYISGADVVYSSVAKTTDKNYCMIIYVNLSGTFFVIGDEEISTRACKANTFVRLGEGAAPASPTNNVNYTPLNEKNTVLALTNIKA